MKNVWGKNKSSDIHFLLVNYLKAEYESMHEQIGLDQSS